jgi:hypothetical protein
MRTFEQQGRGWGASPLLHANTNQENALQKSYQQ